MKSDSDNSQSDLAALGTLALDGVIGVTDLVEAVHHTISSQAWLTGAPSRSRKGGISGFVYWTIRTLSGWIQRAILALAGRRSPPAVVPESSLRREALVSVLNGVLGDHLAVSNNPLAIEMQLRQDGKPLHDERVAAAIAAAGGRVLLLVHGSCSNDLQWYRQGHDHGQALAAEFGLVPIYLYYNSGLHTSENGRAFADLLEGVVAQWPQPVELTIVAHSMGGLVTRSACHYAQLDGQRWLQQLQTIVFLGTPHHGAPLERGGNLVDTLLGISPYSAPFARLGKIRSAGVTDLRYGNVVDADWQGRDRFRAAGDQRVAVPLPPGVSCFAAAATLSKAPSRLDNLVGDGLVPLNSALGIDRRDDLTLGFADSHQWVGRQMNHTALLSSLAVYETVRGWLAPGQTASLP